MKILDVLNSPWSIRPEKMAEIRNIYYAHLRGPKIDWKEIEARVSLSLDDREKQEEPYQLMNGIAVIPVKGVLTKGLSFFSFLFGGASMKQIGIAFQAALDDPSAKAILLDIDSPGGTVDGTEELAEDIYKARGQKPIIAYTDGTMASGAYWIASAADRIYISGDTVLTGSVGVVATHIDQSKADDAYGEKWTEITAGKYKRIASAHAPLTEEGRNYIQDQVDYLYSKFVDTVARNRNVDHEDALAMADGKIFIGWQAVTIGLVDGVEAFSDLINSPELSTGQQISAMGQQISVKEEFKVNLEEIKTKHPDVYAQVLAEGKAAGMVEGEAAGKAAGIEEGKVLGATAERQRIADVRAQLIPGHEALIDQLAADGKTTGPEAAMKIVAAEKTVKAKALDEFKADGALGVKQPVPPVLTEKPEEKDFMAEVERTMTEQKIGRAAAIRIVVKENPKLHEAWLASLKPVKAE